MRSCSLCCLQSLANTKWHTHIQPLELLYCRRVRYKDGDQGQQPHVVNEVVSIELGAPLANEQRARRHLRETGVLPSVTCCLLSQSIRSQGIRH